MVDIQVGFVVTQKGACHAKFLMESIHRTISDPKRVKFVIGAVDRHATEYLMENLSVKTVGEETSEAVTILTESGFTVKVLTLENSQNWGSIVSKSGCWEHSNGIHEILQHMDKGCKYGVIADSDTAFVKPNWDTDLIDELTDKKIVVGACFPTKYKKYQRDSFPVVFMSFFKTKEFLDSVNFRDEISEIGVKKNGLLKDTGWKMGDDVTKSGYSFVCLPFSEEITKKLGIRGEAYTLNGVPVVLHMGRGNRRTEGSADLKKWREAIIKWEYTL